MEQENLRLGDVEQALTAARELEHIQRRVATHALRGSWMTRLSMYAVGVLLIVTLFGVNLPPILTSVLGVVVIVVTILGQQFRPDVKFINAKVHILQLRRMIRTAETELAAIRSGDSEAVEPSAILAHINNVADEVERNHHLDYAVMRERIVSVMPKDDPIQPE